MTHIPWLILGNSGTPMASNGVQRGRRLRIFLVLQPWLESDEHELASAPASVRRDLFRQGGMHGFKQYTAPSCIRHENVRLDLFQHAAQETERGCYGISRIDYQAVVRKTYMVSEDTPRAWLVAKPPPLWARGARGRGQGRPVLQGHQHSPRPC